MFCARVLRSPPGGNISTSTPVSINKGGRPRLEPEPDHSPIEKSNDSRELRIGLSPQTGAPRPPQNARVLALQNNLHTPRRSNAISPKELQKLCPYVVIKEMEERPLPPPQQGLRMSPRIAGYRERSRTTQQKTEGKENANMKTLQQSTNAKRVRSRSHIPMRRKSVSLQDLAVIKTSKNSSQDKHPTTDTLKKSNDKSKIVSSNNVTGNDRNFVKSKSDLVVSKQKATKTDQIVAGETNDNKTDRTKNKTQELTNKVVKNGMSNSKDNETEIVKRKAQESTDIIVKNGISNSIDNKTETKAHKSTNRSVKSKISISKDNETEIVKRKEQESPNKVGKSRISNSKDNKTETKIDELANKVKDKVYHSKDNETETAKQTQELTSQIVNNKVSNSKDNKTEIVSKKSRELTNKTSNFKDNKKHSETLKTSQPIASIKSGGDGRLTAESKTGEKTLHKTAKVSDKPSSVTEKTGKAPNEDLVVNKKTRESNKTTQSEQITSKTIVGAKIFAQESALKTLLDTAPLANSTRDSYESQRNSDTFQVTKTSFIKRKLYSQCNDFNNDSDPNAAETSFLQKKDVKNIYCAEKKSGQGSGGAAKSSSTVEMTNSKDVDAQKNHYSLRNKNVENDLDGKTNTCKFVTKLLEDIQGKSKPVDEKETNDCVTDSNIVSDVIKKKIDRKTKSNTNIFDNVQKDKSVGKVKNKEKLKKKKDTDIETRKSKSVSVKKSTSRKSGFKIDKNLFSDVILVKKKNRSAKTEAINKILNSSSSSKIMNVSSSSGKSPNIVKSVRSAKVHAIDKIHNWSTDINNSRGNANNKVVATIDNTNKKLKTKHSIASKEFVYTSPPKHADDSLDFRLSPHVKKAIKKLKKQQQLTNRSKKPIRRSLEVSVNKKKTVVSSEGRRTVTTSEFVKNYGIKGDNLNDRNRRTEKSGQMMTFRNGQLVSLDKGSTGYNYMNDTTRDSSCSYLRNDRIHDYHNQYSTFQMRPFYRESIENDRNKMPISRGPFKFGLLKGCIGVRPHNRNNHPLINEHLKTNETFIFPPPKETNVSRQIMPYNRNTYAVVSKPPSQIYSCEMPVRKQISHTSMAVHTQRNVPNERENNITVSRRVESSVPSFIKNAFNMSINRDFSQVANSTYSFCAKGVDLMRRKCSNNGFNTKQNLICQNEEQNLISKYYNTQDRENRKRKTPYAVNNADVTVYSKKSKYNDEMSLCSSAGGRTVSSTRLYGDTTRSVAIPESFTNQSVCRFIMGAPLVPVANNTRLPSTVVPPTCYTQNKTNVRTITTTTKHTVVQQKQNECNFSDDMNETVVSKSVHKSVQPHQERVEINSKPHTEKHWDPQVYNNDNTQTNPGTTVADKTNLKKYKFSSEDVYSFGRKADTERKSTRNEDTFYFKGLYNKHVDVSGIQMHNPRTTVNSDDTFRKPTAPKKTGNISILEKYQNLHAMHGTPKKKRLKTSSSSIATPQREESSVDKSDASNRNLVSPWRLW